jgi:acyl-CoA thioester hydrolase
MMDGFAYETTSFVRFRDADPMQMANHAVIVSYLETARTEYMMELLEIERVDEINYVMARVECDYRSPARYGERLRTGVRIEELGETSATLGYRVGATESHRLVAEAKTVQVFYDYDRQAPMPVPEAVREAVDFETGAQR